MNAKSKWRKALMRLQKALDKIVQLRLLPPFSSEFKEWKRDTFIAIKNSFEEGSSNQAEFGNITFSTPYEPFSKPSNEYRQRSYLAGLNNAEALLRSMISEIKEYRLDDDDNPQQTASNNVNLPKDKRKVFVIHGHDTLAKEAVARFLLELKLEPIILHEQPNGGRTIIKKFEDHADVSCAVVLLTPDDLGGAATEDRKSFKPRARQNVIFELGFFLGKLGRKRIITFMKGNVEKPSDYDGVLYIPLDDDGGWKLKLAKELRAADLAIDPNGLID